MATLLNTLQLARPASGVPRLQVGAGLRRLVGVGGIGTGVFFRLEGNRPLGREESRPGLLLDARDYCKLHIISHYVAVLLGAHPSGTPFHVLPVARVGQDDAGRRLLEELPAAGIDTSAVEAVAGHPTLLSVCFLYQDGAGGNVTSSGSAASTLEPGDIDRCEPLLSRAGPSAIALTVPEAPMASRDRLLQLATAHGALRVASFASSEIQAARTLGMLSRIDLLALNLDEASALVNFPFERDNPAPALDACAQTLCAIQPGMRIIVSAGRLGAFGFDRGRWDHCPAPAVTALNTAGGGDALLAGVISALVAGMPFSSSSTVSTPRPLSTALDFGVLLASYSVTSPHTIHPDADLEHLIAFAEKIGLDCSPLSPYLCGSGVAAPSIKMD